MGKLKQVMRSAYIEVKQDWSLMNLAFRHRVTKSDLTTAALGAKLDEWSHPLTGDAAYARDMKLLDPK